MKKQSYFGVIVGIVFLVISGFLYLRTQENTISSGDQITVSSDSEQSFTQELASAAPSSGEKSSDSCAVYICGAVRHPGVYRFQAGSRICDAVRAAGGLSKKAAATAVNQAKLLVDGEQITIPRKSRYCKGSKNADGRRKEESSIGASGLVNINKADKNELMTLSGIGEAKAAMIIEYRKTNGDFQSPEDIMKISGIKDGVYQQIKDSITV